MQSFGALNLKEVAWTLILSASTILYKPQIPIGSEIKKNINNIPVLITRLNNAQINLQTKLLPIITKNSPILVKLIRKAQNHSSLAPLTGCRSVLSQVSLIRSGHYATFVSNIKHILTGYSKECGKCNLIRKNAYTVLLYTHHY